MPRDPNAPDINIVKHVATQLLNQEIMHVGRLTTSNMNYVFTVSTKTHDYVLRMAQPKYKHTYESAIYWQQRLLPLGVPIVKFIAHDLEGKHSPYPAVLMDLVPGDDLCNVYKQLSTDAKQSLAQQMVDIFAKTDNLQVGTTYGFAASYEQPTPYKTWYDFLGARLELCRSSLVKTDAFPNDVMQQIGSIAKSLKANLNSVPPKPFMWDASERNVLIYENQISGIVDVDNMCFGDPLFTLGLTYLGLEVLGCDDIYCDTWANLMNLDPKANLRLQFYRLFYTVWFMRHYADKVSENGTAYNMDADVLNKLFTENLTRINALLASNNA